MTFEEYVATRGAALVRFARLITGDDHRAEDLVQDILSRAYPRWQRIQSADRPDVYVRRMLVNANHSWWRRLASREGRAALLRGRGRRDSVPCGSIGWDRHRRTAANRNLRCSAVARVLDCALSLSGAPNQVFVEGSSRWVMATARPCGYVPSTPSAFRHAETNRVVGGRPAFAYPGGDQLEIWYADGFEVSAYVGKAYSGYTEVDATLVLAGLRVSSTPDDLTSWPGSLVEG